MSKLSRTTKKFRRYVIYFLVFAIVVIIIQSIYRYITSDQDIGGPNSSQYAYVNELFGEISYPSISSMSVSDESTPSFSISGQFSESAGSVNVYKVNKPRETLGNSKKAQEIADNLNLGTSYELNGIILTWRSPNKELLEYNKLTNDVRFVNEGINIATLRKNKPNFLDIEKINNEVSSIVRDLSQINFGSQQDARMSYLLSAGGGYQTTEIPENADFIRTDFYIYKEIVSTRALTRAQEQDPTTIRTESISARLYLDNPTQGTTNIITSNQELSQFRNDESNDQIREFNELGIDISEEVATYSLRTFEQAWEDVQDGKAFLKYLVKQGEDPLDPYEPTNVKRFIVDPEKSKLGFFTTQEWTVYIFPIYVFEGIAELQDGTTAEFIFYAKAIETVE